MEREEERDEAERANMISKGRVGSDHTAVSEIVCVPVHLTRAVPMGGIHKREFAKE